MFSVNKILIVRFFIKVMSLGMHYKVKKMTSI